MTEALESYTGSYFLFTRELELGSHNRGHDWIGGDMANVRFSPNDVAFWLHHATVDRIWAKWQQVNPGEHAHLEGDEATMDPWGFTVETINDISKLGEDSYSYEDPKRPIVAA